jgi:opacity protein-like surface antigen
MLRFLFVLAGLVFASPAMSEGLKCYGEASVGSSVSTASTDAGLDLSARGFNGGVGLGCDVRLSGFLVGALARYDISSADGTVLGLAYEAKPMWTVAGRAGVPINEGVLLYGVLGYSGASFDIDTVAKSRHTGLTLGLGVDIALRNTPALLRIEYDRTSWNTKDYGGVAVDPTTDVIRAGVLWKLN